MVACDPPGTNDRKIDNPCGVFHYMSMDWMEPFTCGPATRRGIVFPLPFAKRNMLPILLAVMLTVFPGHSLGQRSPVSSIEVLKIHHEVVDESTERVCLKLSGFQIPTFEALPGDKPRVFMDIAGVVRWAAPNRIASEGRMVVAVRNHHYPKEQRLRIVLDLEPKGDYLVDPIYIESGNIFCLEVRMKMP